MNRMTKVALGVMTLAVGIGGISAGLNGTSQVDGIASASPYSISFGSDSGLTKYVSGTTSYISQGVTWTIANVPGYVANDAKDWHLGSGKKALSNFTLSTAATNFGSGITSVSVELWGGSDNTLSISGNGTSEISKTAVPTSSNTITATFPAPVSAGDLVITLNEGITKTAATYLSQITISYATDDVDITGISLSESSISGYPGDTHNLSVNYQPVNTTQTAVTWEAVDPSIASVNEGAVTFHKVGSTTITATSTSSPLLTASCSVSVIAGDVYSLVTDINSLRVGADVVFVNQTNSKGMAKATVNTNYMDQTTVILETNSVSQTSNLGIFTFGIGSEKDTFTFKNKADSKYLTTGTSGSVLTLGSTVSASSEWSITLDASYQATITANSRSVYYNNSLSDFASSTTAAASGQEIFIYQKAATSGILDTVDTTGTLTKSSYKTGDTFDATGLTITGLFDDNDATTADLSAWVVWPTTALVTGQTTIEGTLNVLGVSKTVSATIEVHEVTLISIAITTSASKLTYAAGDNLDTTGLVVTATYTDNVTEDVTSKCTISPANGSTLSSVGTVAVQISFLGKTISYDVTVEAPAYTLKKVTSESQLVIGAKIVVLSDTSSPVAMSTTQNTSNRGVAAVTPSSETLNLLSSSTAAVFTLGSGTTSGTYSLKDTSGFLYAGSSSNNVLKSEITLDANGSWTITFATASGVTTTTLTAQGGYSRNVLQYNSGSKIFSCYSSASQKGIVLYEQVAYYNAATWAASFNAALDLTCSDTNPTAIASTTWGDQNTSFSNLTTDEKAILKAASTADDKDKTSLKKAMSRYDYIMGKSAYSSFTDFIARFPARAVPGASGVAKQSSADNVLYITAGISLVAAASVLIYARKKKQA